jgi:hypothetical protein
MGKTKEERNELSQKRSFLIHVLVFPKYPRPSAADDTGFRDLLLHAGFTEGQIQDARGSITSNELSGDTFLIREEQRIADHQADLQDMLRYWSQLKQDGEMGSVP